MGKFAGIVFGAIIVVLAGLSFNHYLEERSTQTAAVETEVSTESGWYDAISLVSDNPVSVPSETYSEASEEVTETAIEYEIPDVSTETATEGKTYDPAGDAHANYIERKKNHSQTSSSSSGGYIGNKDSMIFHDPDCRWVSEMNDSNKVFLNSRDEAISEEYTPCGTCKP